MTTKKRSFVNLGKRDLLIIFVLVTILMVDGVVSIRLQQQSPLDGRRIIIVPDAKEQTTTTNQTPLKTAVFALGSFWRSEAVFGCLNGVERTTSGYAGGTPGFKTNPEFRSLGDHAECVQVFSFSFYYSLSFN
ncbi:Peptide methionine sulfoxide reductase a5 [Thalictrum thalictroides]|uniref:peptide-methionine (S)-S-oxide reductase n=1 Tax=Thalictrum thalictroides TaxID=46969 RepID=A0A7J6WUJ8_THATH|nr:Peptide methionine sulfoxide reductase a5 [Thalictrum thalictroides]